jgi:hypothetical protein
MTVLKKTATVVAGLVVAFSAQAVEPTYEKIDTDNDGKTDFIKIRKPNGSVLTVVTLPIPDETKTLNQGISLFKQYTKAIKAAGLNYVIRLPQNSQAHTTPWSFLSWNCKNNGDPTIQHGYNKYGEGTLVYKAIGGQSALDKNCQPTENFTSLTEEQMDDAGIPREADRLYEMVSSDKHLGCDNMANTCQANKDADYGFGVALRKDAPIGPGGVNIQEGFHGVTHASMNGGASIGVINADVSNADLSKIQMVLVAR